jgi:peptide/nickel transport system substrate-binding protein
VSADALSYTFHLRKGVRFHDGTAFTTQALIATLDRQPNKNDPNYIGSSGPV